VYNLAIGQDFGWQESNVKLNSYLLHSGKLQRQADISVPPDFEISASQEVWYDIVDARSDELKKALSALKLHPLMLNRCLDKISTPGVISFGNAILMEYPVAVNLDTDEPSYISIILQYPVLITVRHSALPVIDDLVEALMLEEEAGINHLVQLVYIILDELTDLSVDRKSVV
jgi:Mg2+ and Co2+ transporter CorA